MLLVPPELVMSVNEPASVPVERFSASAVVEIATLETVRVPKLAPVIAEPGVVPTMTPVSVLSDPSATPFVAGATAPMVGADAAAGSPDVAYGAMVKGTAELNDTP